MQLHFFLLVLVHIFSPDNFIFQQGIESTPLFPAGDKLDSSVNEKKERVNTPPPTNIKKERVDTPTPTDQFKKPEAVISREEEPGTSGVGNQTGEDGEM